MFPVSGANGIHSQQYQHGTKTFNLKEAAKKKSEQVKAQAEQLHCYPAWIKS